MSRSLGAPGGSCTRCNSEERQALGVTELPFGSALGRDPVDGGGPEPSGSHGELLPEGWMVRQGADFPRRGLIHAGWDCRSTGSRIQRLNLSLHSVTHPVLISSNPFTCRSHPICGGRRVAPISGVPVGVRWEAVGPGPYCGRCNFLSFYLLRGLLGWEASVGSILPC